jgi:hypothetical protein
MAMAQVAYPDPGHKIQVFFPLHVPNPAPFSPNQDYREPPIGLGQHFLRNLDHFFVCHLFPFSFFNTFSPQRPQRPPSRRNSNFQKPNRKQTPIIQSPKLNNLEIGSWRIIWYLGFGI